MARACWDRVRAQWIDALGLGETEQESALPCRRWLLTPYRIFGEKPSHRVMENAKLSRCGKEDKIVKKRGTDRAEVGVGWGDSVISHKTKDYIQAVEAQ